jgi:GTP-binding protein
VSFRREKFVDRGGPDGGDGGRGGAILFEASRQRNTLVDFRFNKTYRAEDGRPGLGKQMYGRKGLHLTLLVPVGTLIRDDETREVLADLSDEGEQFVIDGGKGGLGNMHFKSSTRRTPRVATPGEDGTELRVHLELKLMSDIGLLGFPNAGKSTLISRISAARPRVAAYPFTTLTPNLGVVDMGEGRSFVVADIPGLIEGAAEGAGLGHQFLRHVDRCKALLQLVSPVDEAADYSVQSILERFQAIQDEVAAYDAKLAKRVRIVALTKTDLLSPDQVKEARKALQEASGAPVYAISAVAGTGLARLKGALVELIDTPPDDDELSSPRHDL